MESLDYWRMCDDLSVIQCIILILGKDPKNLEDLVESSVSKRPEGYEAVRTAVMNAVRRGKLPAHIIREAWEHGWGEEVPSDAEYVYPAEGSRLVMKVEPDWHRTTIGVEDLRVWLQGRSMNSGFFFSSHSDSPTYLDQKHKHYAPKLAAALEAWEAVTADTSLTRSRSVKTALTTWLNKNAARFGLIKDDGTPNKQAIEEAAKVANWDTKGGAPKTPSEPDHPFSSR